MPLDVWRGSVPTRAYLEGWAIPSLGLRPNRLIDGDYRSPFALHLAIRVPKSTEAELKIEVT
ncbi:MAG TPA: hypothetical protein VJ180_01585 [Pyrinomonadaceae bacterium]|nr:hypothetical protein [Pyrinomonadaceae bacterium]